MLKIHHVQKREKTSKREKTETRICHVMDMRVTTKEIAAKFSNDTYLVNAYFQNIIL